MKLLGTSELQKALYFFTYLKTATPRCFYKSRYELKNDNREKKHLENRLVLDKKQEWLSERIKL